MTSGQSGPTASARRRTEALRGAPIGLRKSPAKTSARSLFRFKLLCYRRLRIEALDRIAGIYAHRPQLREQLCRRIDLPRWNDHRNVQFQRRHRNMRPTQPVEVQQYQLRILQLQKVRTALNGFDPKRRRNL